MPPNTVVGLFTEELSEDLEPLNLFTPETHGSTHAESLTTLNDSTSGPIIVSLDIEGVDIPMLGTIKEQKEKEQIKLLNEHKDLFDNKLIEPGMAEGMTHNIITTSATPINQAPYRAGHKERDIIHEQVEDMWKKGVIKPSQSPWAAAVVLVPKKDGTIRFCIDYRPLNAVTKKDVYPLPRIDDYVSVLHNASWFCTFDLTSGYWQVPMNPADKEQTAFITKCHLCRSNISYLGHVIDAKGIYPDPAKIEAIKQMKAPTNKSEVYSFVWLCSYYRKFVKNFAFIASPLHRLLADDVTSARGIRRPTARPRVSLDI